jgi:hypothetical protein
MFLFPCVFGYWLDHMVSDFSRYSLVVVLVNVVGTGFFLLVADM